MPLYLPTGDPDQIAALLARVSPADRERFILRAALHASEHYLVPRQDVLGYFFIRYLIAQGKLTEHIEEVPEAPLTVR